MDRIVPRDPPFSTLELDPAATAPQTAYATDPERAYATGLERANSIGPELAYDDTLPEFGAQGVEKEHATASNKAASVVFLSLHVRKKTLRISILLAVLLAIIAIGIGLGVGLYRSHGTSEMPDSSPTSSSASPPSTPSSTSSSVSPASTSKDHNVLNDTSLASVTTADGTRHVFFQEHSGVIRESIYHGSSWTAPINYVIDHTAQNSTPIAAVSIPANVTGFASDQIYLFYIAANSTLAGQVFELQNWNALTYNLLPSLSTSIAIHPDTKSLSATYSPGKNSTSSVSIYLFYENENGTASLLYGSVLGTGHTSVRERQIGGVSAPDISWRTLNIQEDATSVTNGTRLTGPLSLQSTFTNSSGLVFTGVNTVSTVLTGSNYSLVFVVYQDGILSQKPSLIQVDDNSIAKSDLALTFTWWFYVGNSTLQNLERESTPPVLSPFPYSRLSTFSSGFLGSADKFYLYHQVNDTTFAEDVYDEFTGHWLSTNVSVETN